MTKKNSKKVSLGHVPMLLLWVVVLGLTAVRLLVACSGSLGESEALISVCAIHPAGGYVEGPCGVPLLADLLLAGKGLFGGAPLLALRWLSPIAILLLSWCVWKISRKIAPHRPAVALWSVLGINLLPWVNVASGVMDGAVVTASLILLSIVAGWNAVDSAEAKVRNGKQPPGTLLPWILFGVTLGLGTLFAYSIGWLLPCAIVAHLFLHRGKSLPIRGILMALSFLLLGWIFPLIWNSRYDWIQWSSVARGFDCYPIGGFTYSLALCVALSALLVPALVNLASSALWWRRVMIALLIGMSLLSALVLVMPSMLPPSLPSPLGVQGVGELARMVLSLQKERLDAKYAKSFLIAQSSGLAALLEAKITITYPERPGAPSVFVAESPSLNSSYALWPSYADAVTPAAKDINYTEEFISPFLGRNALYITTESKQELPQTITGAFGAVGLLKEMTITKNGQPETIRIYQCDNYRSLSL